MSDPRPSEELLRRVLTFDGRCPFCTASARWVERRLPPGTRILPLQEVADPAAYGLTEEELSSAAYWIDARGRAHRGHLAAARALQAIGGGWGLLGEVLEIPPFSWLAALVYALVARIRHRLPGVTPAVDGTGRHPEGVEQFQRPRGDEREDPAEDPHRGPRGQVAPGPVPEPHHRGAGHRYPRHLGRRRDASR